MRNWTIILLSLAGFTTLQDYSTCESWDELVAGNDYQYVTPVRVSDPGSSERPAYTGFWFYDEQQFDITGRYALGMKVYFQERDVEPSDRGDIGYFDLHDGYKWRKIGESTGLISTRVVAVMEESYRSMQPMRDWAGKCTSLILVTFWIILQFDPPMADPPLD